jgi:2,3-bisphosphoglycerate-dependent phosphoglycerate mutase
MSGQPQRTLVLVRHGQSEWNEQNLFTGWKDVALTPLGMEEAKRAGQALKHEGFHFDIAFTSMLRRARETLRLILAELGQSEIPIHSEQALNERDYGELTGLNKAEAIERWGAEKVRLWRRSYDLTPPGGESLKDTAARVLPYFQNKILPDVLEGRTVLIAAHGNSLRSLIMDLEHLGQPEIEAFSLATGVPRIYHLNADGSVADIQNLEVVGSDGDL